MSEAPAVRRILVELEPFDSSFPVHEASKKEHPVNDSAPKLDIPLSTAGPRPLVGVVMDSDSGWPTMEPAVAVPAELGIAYEVGVVSAHRMPEDMLAYGHSASARGLRVIITGAGGAAHLPGMFTTLTEFAVVNVPAPFKHLDGVDSLHFIVRMPAGVSVATVSIAGACSTDLLAVRILSAGKGPEAEALRAKIRDFRKGLRDLAWDKGATLTQKVRPSSQG